ncbi:MAG: Tripartite-type tricarboxylate transporter, receptor component TctC [Hyphomicrobiales bacterium]|nr:Tripartite-type tricarboxylate transporter, receptor component TctC [Hyphomicrobiales bacterium]
MAKAFGHIWRALALAAVALASTGAQAQDEAAFFKGKTVRILVGGASGAAYDFVGRALAAHMGRHIPGEPNVIVENMPGAASIVMMNHLYNRAARDGTAMGMPLNGIVLEPRLKSLSRDGTNVHFELSKMRFVGTPAQQPQVLWVWHQTPFNSIADLRAKPSNFGSTAPGGDNYILPTLSNALLGTQMKIIAGYKGVNDIFLAAEQGEVHGATVNFSSLLGKPDWMAAGKARILIQFGTERLANLKDVPTAIELAKDEAGKQMLRVYATKFKTTYPILLPPEVPAARVKTMQAAFDATMLDKAFIADAEKIGIDVSPLGGAEIEKVMAEIDAAPQDVIDRLRQLVN